MRIRYLFFLIILIIVARPANGQFSFIYKKYSSDSSHFLVSKPYASQEFDTLGITSVYKSDSTLIWAVERYFAGEEVYLSNDGKTITFIVPFNDDDWPISQYKEGSVFKRFELDDLVDLNNGYSRMNWVFDYHFKGGIKDTLWIHSTGSIMLESYAPDSIELEMYKRKHFSNGDTVFIISSDEHLLKIDQNTGSIDRMEIARSYFEQGRVKADSLGFIRLDTNFRVGYGLPNLQDSSPFDESLASAMNWKNITTSELGRYKSKKHIRIDISVLIDEKGKAEILSLSGWDEKSMEKVRDFILGSTFDTSHTKSGVNKKYFFDIVHLDMKCKNCAQH